MTKIKFKDIVKKIGKTTLYTSYPIEVVEALNLKKGDAVEIDVIILKGEDKN